MSTYPVNPRSKPIFMITAIITAGVWSVAFTSFAVRQTTNLQLLLLPLSLAFLVVLCISLFRPFIRWRREGWRSLIPFLACFFAIILSREMGIRIRHYVFEKKLLPHFESVIQQMESGGIPVSTKGDFVPQAEGGWTLRVFARRSTEGKLSVMFLTGGGFPVKHSGYLYSASGTMPEEGCPERWPYVIQVRPSWFEVSD